MTTIVAPDPAAILNGDTDPIGHPSANDTQRALLAWADAHPLERATIPKDGNGRYKATPPSGGKPKGHTRVTAFASALDDTEGLTTWRHNILAEGIVSTDEMVAALRTAIGNGDKGARRRHINAALHIAGEKLKADLGTAMHLAMEHAICGTGHRPPAPWDADVDAALTAMAAYGIKPAEARWVERVAYIDTFEIIGTIDLLVAGPWGDELRVLDYKTGSSPERIGYAVQLPCYAHASHLWRLDGEGWEPAPQIDQGTALICHMPAGTGQASIVEVDCTEGWGLAHVAADVRAARSAASLRRLFTIAAKATMPEPVRDLPAGERTEWLLDLIRTITDPADRARLARDWPEGTATKAPWTDAEIDTLAPIVQALAPTLSPDPAAPATAPAPTPAAPDPAPIDDGTPADPADEARIVAAVKSLTKPQLERLLVWARDGRTSGNEWAGGPDKRTARTVAIQGAAIAAVAAFWDDDQPDLLTRLAIAHIGGDTTGHVGIRLGHLTHDQATRLHQLADAFAASQPGAVALCGDLVAATHAV